MRLLTIPRPGVLVPVEVPDPLPGPGELRVRVACVGVCGSDVEIFLGHRAPKTRHGYPVVGHELAGVVDAVGEAVSGIRSGDRVTCVEGWGALADYIVTTPQNTLVFDDRIAFEDGCLLEVLPGVAMASWRTGIGRACDVLVVGQGLSGLLITRMVRLSGCRRLVTVDPNPAKLEIASEFGSDDVRSGRIENLGTQLSLDYPGGFDVAILATPACVIDAVVPLMRPRSRIVAYGGLDQRGTVDILALHQRSVSVVKEGEAVNGVLEARQIWREALQTAYDGLLPLRRLRTHEFPMQEAQSAFEIRAQGDALALHVLLHNGPGESSTVGQKDDTVANADRATPSGAVDAATGTTS